MKHFLITLLTITVFTAGSFSQKFNGGAYVGIVGSEVDGDSLGGLKKVGLNGGFYTNLELTEKFYLQFELAYVQKGSQKNADHEIGDYSSFKIKTDYVEVPVLAQFKPREWLRFELGPSIAFLVNGKEFINGYENTPSVDFRPVTFNAIAGANFEFVRNLSLNIRFNTSINSIRKGDQSGYVKRFPFFVYGQYHNCLILSLKFRFLRFGS